MWTSLAVAVFLGAQVPEAAVPDTSELTDAFLDATARELVLGARRARGRIRRLPSQLHRPWSASASRLEFAPSERTAPSIGVRRASRVRWSRTRTSWYRCSPRGRSIPAGPAPMPDCPARRSTRSTIRSRTRSTSGCCHRTTRTSGSSIPWSGEVRDTTGTRRATRSRFRCPTADVSGRWKCASCRGSPRSICSPALSGSTPSRGPWCARFIACRERSTSNATFDGSRRRATIRISMKPRASSAGSRASSSPWRWSSAWSWSTMACGTSSIGCHACCARKERLAPES